MRTQENTVNAKMRRKKNWRGEMRNSGREGKESRRKEKSTEEEKRSKEKRSRLRCEVNENVENVTNDDAVGENEERDVWCKSAEDQTTSHHHPTEYGYRTGAKIIHTGTAEWT